MKHSRFGDASRKKTKKMGALKSSVFLGATAKKKLRRRDWRAAAVQCVRKVAIVQTVHYRRDRPPLEPISRRNDSDSLTLARLALVRRTRSIYTRERSHGQVLVILKQKKQIKKKKKQFATVTIVTLILMTRRTIHDGTQRNDTRATQLTH